MPTPTEQALITLVPTLHSLPPELVELSTSLLAQSRTKAATLKPEEEIGRIYVCANIACERLKQRLGFEKLQPRPPCPPKVYKKLYAYLDKALQGPSTPRTPRHKDAIASTQRSGGGSGRLGTRSAQARADQLEDETPSRRSEKRPVQAPIQSESNRKRKVGALSTKLAESDSHIQLPSFVNPMAEALCTRFNAPSAITHVLFGLRFVLKKRSYDTTAETTAESDNTGASSTSSRKRPRTSSPVKLLLPAGKGLITPSRIPALMIVLTLYTVHKLNGTDIEPNEYRIQRAMGIAAVRTLPEGYLQSDDELMSDIEGLLKAAVAEEWIMGAWFIDIGTTATADEAMDDDDGSDEDVVVRGNRKDQKTPLRRREKHRHVDDFEWDSAAGLKSGLGTMFQDALDWLSDDRRQVYSVWEKGLLAKIEVMETEMGPSAVAGAL